MDTDELLLSFAALLSHVMRADGKTTQDEKEVMEAMFAKMRLTRAQYALAIGSFMLVQWKGGSPKADAEKLAELLNGTGRTFLYGLLWRVANADWRVAKCEERLLDEIGAALEIDEGIRAQYVRGSVPTLRAADLEAAGVPSILARLGDDGEVTGTAAGGLGFWSRFG